MLFIYDYLNFIFYKTRHHFHNRLIWLKSNEIARHVIAHLNVWGRAFSNLYTFTHKTFDSRNDLIFNSWS